MLLLKPELLSSDDLTLGLEVPLKSARGGVTRSIDGRSTAVFELEELRSRVGRNRLIDEVFEWLEKEECGETSSCAKAPGMSSNGVGGPALIWGGR